MDAVIIGGGFFGAAIASYLSRRRNLDQILLVEREGALLTRASYNNQARVHNGYHYPRSFTTAYRSRVNFPRFVHDWADVITSDFTKLYAIPLRNSRTSARQFLRFCRDIGATIEPADESLSGLFERRLVEQVFLVKEYAFDANKLAIWANRELRDCGVEVRLSTTVTGVTRVPDGTLQVWMQPSKGDPAVVSSPLVFNCTYSGLNQLGGDFPGIRTGLKQEITEMALLQMPPSLKGLGITLMDGPFFSVMPFPARGLHTLSHVRYTPHLSYEDRRGVDPYQKLRDYDKATRVDRMLRDAGRYLPPLLDARYVDSLFEVKTILVKSETDDGRPILFEKHEELPGCYSILGGKLDNIYDVLARLDVEDFGRQAFRVRK